MAKFTAPPGVNERVARMVAQRVARMAERVEDIVKQECPGTKVWISMEDLKVRPTHVEAHGQEVPENLRFDIRSMEWDMEHANHLGPRTFMDAPRDFSSGAIANIGVPWTYHLKGEVPTRINAEGQEQTTTVTCRCQSVPDPEGLKKTVTRTPVTQSGSRVYATIAVNHELARKCNDGDLYADDPASGGFPVPPAEPTYFWDRALSLSRAAIAKP